MGKKEIPFKIEPGFEDAVNALRDSYQDRHQEAHSRFDIYFSHSTVARFLDPSYQGILQPAMQRRLIHILENDIGLARHKPENTLYDYISSQIDQPLADKQKIFERYCGQYYYFRKLGNADNDTRDYRKGRITIFGENDVPKFNHWSQDYTEEKPEHSGFVFIGGQKLFMLGFKDNVIRLAIAGISGRPTNEVMQGIVASVKTSDATPYASRFVLVHDSNKLEISKLEKNVSYFETKWWAQVFFLAGVSGIRPPV